MLLFDHLVVLLFAGLYPAYDFFCASKRFKKNVEVNKPGVRIKEYQSGIAGIWILSLLALVNWLVNDREFVNLGFDFSVDWTVFLGLGLGLLALYYIIYIYRSLKDDTEQLNSLRAKMKDKSASIYLPRTRNEFRWFVLVSISAGICEELLFRGFLMWYIGQFGPIIVAVLISSILFGFAHAYQGWKGILQSGLLGWIAFDETFQKDINQ